MWSGLYRSDVSQPCDRNKKQEPGQLFCEGRYPAVSSGEKCKRLWDFCDWRRDGLLWRTCGDLSESQCLWCGKNHKNPRGADRKCKGNESVCGSFCQGLCGIQRRQSDPWCDSESDIPNDVSAVKADHRRNPAGESVRVCSGGEGLCAGKPSSGSGDAGRNRRSAW